MKRLLFLMILAMGPLATQAAERVILVFGDSISAGYGLARIEQGWVALLQTRLKQQGYGYRVINASVSGETTAGGLARLPRALAMQHPAVVLLELGGNDGLRALPLAQMRTNLATMIDLSRNAGAEVLLLGMRIPPNYGGEYTAGFANTFDTLAREKRVPLVPFLLEGVGLDPTLMQADGVHPLAAAEGRLLDNLWPHLRALLRR